MAFSFSEAKRIPIIEYLSRTGLEPSSIRGNDYWYMSPLRHERTPSFKVNVKLNLWYDHGSGEGGTLVDLGTKMNRCSPHEFLEQLTSGNYSVPNSLPIQNSLQSSESRLKIVGASDLRNADLIHYLEERKIKVHFAVEYCKEIEFSIGRATYIAAGFTNRSGGYELRNRWFKGSSSPKDVSIIDHGTPTICVVEGFMDFLSLLTLNQYRAIELPLKSSFLVLNSLSLLNKNLDIFHSHRDIHLFLDNDLAGIQAKTGLVSKGIPFRDGSREYASHKDVNEFLMHNRGRAVRRSKGLGC